MRRMDLSRLAPIGAGEVLAIGPNITKTIVGCADGAHAWYAQFYGSDPVLVAYHEPGRFRFEVGAAERMALFCQPVGDETGVWIEQPLAPTRSVGDPAESFTTVDHRPAMNPELNAVLRQMRLQDGEIRRLNQAVQSMAKPRPASTSSPAPAPELDPDPVTPDPVQTDPPPAEPVATPIQGDPE